MALRRYRRGWADYIWFVLKPVRDEGASSIGPKTHQEPGSQLMPLGAVYGVTEEQTWGSAGWGWNGPLSLLLVATLSFLRSICARPALVQLSGLCMLAEVGAETQKKNFASKGCLGDKGFVVMGESGERHCFFLGVQSGG